MTKTSVSDNSGDSDALSSDRLPLAVVPRHVAIIMDGNNRWAKKHKKGKLGGHRAGVDAVRKVIEACGDYGVEVLTLFAFSSENWNRPPEEVKGLMELFLRALKFEVKRLRRHRIRLKVIGDLTAFSPAIQKHIRQAEELTSSDYKVTLVIAASYGGQWDIIEATRKLAELVKAGQLEPAAISAGMFEQHLVTGDLPPPDLLIRTSGEHRISNFLLWQCAYSEFYFTNVLWPDFDPDEFYKALQCFSQRQRRFGQTSEQVELNS